MMQSFGRVMARVVINHFPTEPRISRVFRHNRDAEQCSQVTWHVDDVANIRQ